MGDIDGEQTTDNCGFHLPLAHLSIFHFIAVEVGGFFQHAITGHVPLKTRYDKHTHTLTLNMDFTGVFIYLLYLPCNESSTQYVP